MQLSKEIITVSADSIHDTGSHLFWTGPADESLTDSINEFGQAAPVLAREADNGFELIAGHARLSTLRQLNQPVLVRLVLDADERDMGLLYLADNAQRPLDDGMRLAALRYFQTLMNEKELKSDILPRLGIKPKSKDAKLLFSWLDMPGNWLAHLATGNVPLAAVTPIKRMSDTDRLTVEPLFAGFSWSRSNAVNLLTWLFETSKMTEAPIADVMQQAGMAEIMKQGLSPKDTIARLCTAAKAARYPELSILQDRFNKAAGEIAAGTKWRVVQPNNFETGGAELTIQVKDAAQLKKAVEDLETMTGISRWKDIWELGGKND